MNAPAQKTQERLMQVLLAPVISEKAFRASVPRQRYPPKVGPAHTRPAEVSAAVTL